MSNNTDNLNHTQLTAQDISNLKQYGALTPQEFAPEDNNLQPGQCICEAFDCPTSYECWTHGV